MAGYDAGTRRSVLLGDSRECLRSVPEIVNRMRHGTPDAWNTDNQCQPGVSIVPGGGIAAKRVSVREPNQLELERVMWDDHWVRVTGDVHIADGDRGDGMCS